MGGGNGAKSAHKREMNAKAASKGPTSQLKTNAAAQTIQCNVCKQTFQGTSKQPLCVSATNAARISAYPIRCLASPRISHLPNVAASSSPSSPAPLLLTTPIQPHNPTSPSSVLLYIPPVLLRSSVAERLTHSATPFSTLQQHAESRHAKNTFVDCFPTFVAA